MERVGIVGDESDRFSRSLNIGDVAEKSLDELSEYGVLNLLLYSVEKSGRSSHEERCRVEVPNASRAVRRATIVELSSGILNGDESLKSRVVGTEGERRKLELGVVERDDGGAHSASLHSFGDS